MATRSDPPRQRQPRMAIEVRREHVLDAALRLVIRGGYGATTMEAVSREAQLAKPRVYAAYPGRGPLLLALLEREQERAVADLNTAMPDFTDVSRFADTLASAATNLLHAVVNCPDSWRVLNAPADDAPPEVKVHAAQIRDTALANLQALITFSRGREPGLDEFDADILAASLLAVGEQLVRMTLTEPDRYPPDRLTAFITTTADKLTTSL